MVIPALYYGYNHIFPFVWAEVLRLEGEGNYTVFFLTNGEQHLTSKTIGVYEPHLPAGFVRIHKNCVINWQFAETFDSPNKSIVLTDGQVVKVARRKMGLIKKLTKATKLVKITRKTQKAS
jgi:two-component system LytT family response regulator